MAGGRVFAREVKGHKVLFVRSSVVDKLMKVFSPARWARQTSLARDVLNEALSRAYPELDRDQLRAAAGIRSSGSIRIADAAKLGDKARKLLKAKIKEDLGAALKHGKVKLNGVTLDSSPSLNKFLNLKGTDLWCWFNHPNIGHRNGLSAFQEFLRGATTPAGSSADEQAANVKGVASYLSAWSHLPAADKDELRNKLSADGQAAMAAMDTLVPNIVRALNLPITASTSLGINDGLANDLAVMTSIGNVSQTLAKMIGKSEGEARQAMQDCAKDLGLRFSAAIRSNLEGRVPSSLLTQSHQLQLSVRNVLDKYMNPAKACVSKDGPNAAIRLWVDQKDGFINQVCAATMHGLLAAETAGQDGQLKIAGHLLFKGKVLGMGAEGEVSLARMDSAEGKALALKSVKPLVYDIDNKPVSPREALLHELAASTKSPHVVGFMGAVGGKDGSMTIAMEFAPHGNLDDVIGALRTQQAGGGSGAVPSDQLQALNRHVLRSMASGLQALHELGIRHRDIKGGNFFIGEQGMLKVGDFGRSVLAAEDICTTPPNDTPQWMAPEFSKMKGPVQYTPGADIWAAGIVMLELATGKISPFDSGSFKSDGLAKLDAFRNNPDYRDPAMRAEALGLGELQKTDPELANLLLDMLHPNPAQRPSASTILERLPAAANEAAMGKLLIDLAKQAA